MPLIHEFGIISDIQNERLYNDYVPHLNDCIGVDDAIVQGFIEQLTIMKTYFLSLNRPELGLAYYGTTLIPPESLPLFLDILLAFKKFKNSSELNALCEKIMLALAQNKYIVHFGI